MKTTQETIIIPTAVDEELLTKLYNDSEDPYSKEELDSISQVLEDIIDYSLPIPNSFLQVTLKAFKQLNK
jgi:hypothetical protein